MVRADAAPDETAVFVFCLFAVVRPWKEGVQARHGRMILTESGYSWSKCDGSWRMVLHHIWLC